MLKRALILFFFISAASSLAAEHVSEQDALGWRKEKLAELRRRIQEYGEVIQKHERGTKKGGQTTTSSAAEAQKVLADGQDMLRELEALDRKNYPFLESSNFEALHRFKDNALCAPGVSRLKQSMESQKQEQSPSKGELLAIASGVYATCSAPSKFGELKNVLEDLQKAKPPVRPHSPLVE